MTSARARQYRFCLLRDESEILSNRPNHRRESGGRKSRGRKWGSSHPGRSQQQQQQQQQRESSGIWHREEGVGIRTANREINQNCRLLIRHASRTIVISKRRLLGKKTSIDRQIRTGLSVFDREIEQRLECTCFDVRTKGQTND